MKRARVSSVQAQPSLIRPFWSPDVAKLSEKLWQPTLLCRLKRHPGHGWHTMTKFITLAGPVPKHIDFDVEPDYKPPPRKRQRKADEAPKVQVPLRVRKHKLILEAQDRATLKKWFGAARWVYNKTVDELKAGKPISTEGLKAMRHAFVNDDAFQKENTWMLEVPRDVRCGAHEDAIQALKANLVHRKKDPSFHFEMKHRTKKATSESIYICYRGLGTMDRIYPRSLKGKIRYSPKRPEVISTDCRLQRTKLGEYFLCVPTSVEPSIPKEENNAPRVIALDPGVRTFLTGYDPSGRVLEFGKRDNKRLKRLCLHLDALQSKISDKSIRAHKRYRLRRASIRLRERIKNLRDDAHKKIAHSLTLEYDMILLPKFETSRMVKKSTRKFSSKVARAMYTWAHYSFQQMLINKAKLTKTAVKIVDESYTSVTCGKCGKLHPNLGIAEVYECPFCDHVVGRDINAARNILLKNAAMISFGVFDDTESRESLSPGTSPSFSPEDNGDAKQLQDC